MKTAISYLELFGSISESKILNYKVLFFKDNIKVASIPRKDVKMTCGLTNLIYELWFTMTHEKLVNFPIP